ncbi:MAG: glycosyltransferase family 2 protein [candidate division WOR-3 bacterium]
MTKDSGSVCAIVVTYNRKNLLIECLEALRRQTRPLDGIYVIDNASTDDTPAYLMEKGYIAEIPPSVLLEPYEREYLLGNYVNGGSIRFHYVRLPENTGGAGGFHEGMKRAYEKGYDWMWLMDDDAEAKEDALERLLSFGENLYILGAKLETKDFKNLYETNNYLRDSGLITPVNTLPFVGFLIRNRVVECIGYPIKELFVLNDDVEYSLRARSAGFQLFVVESAKIFHPSWNCFKVNFLNISLALNIYQSQAKLYYSLRNSLAIFVGYRDIFGKFGFAKKLIAYSILAPIRAFFTTKNIFLALDLLIKSLVHFPTLKRRISRERSNLSTKTCGKYE